MPLTALGAIFLVATFIPFHGWDLHAYWIVDPAHPYDSHFGSLSGFGAFRYAPPIAWLMAPLGMLPWPAVTTLWLGLQLGALWLIAGRWALALVVFPPVWLDLVYGNVYVMMTAAIIVGFRFPSAWAFVLLTKVTPGVGLIWFGVRHEWRGLAVVAFVTGTALLVTWPQVPDWLAMLSDRWAMPLSDRGLDVPLLPRVVAAAVLVAWGGLTDRRWVVPVGTILAMPVVWAIALTPLVAVLPLLRQGRR